MRPTKFDKFKHHLMSMVIALLTLIFGVLLIENEITLFGSLVSGIGACYLALLITDVFYD